METTNFEKNMLAIVRAELAMMGQRFVAEIVIELIGILPPGKARNTAATATIDHCLSFHVLDRSSEIVNLMVAGADKDNVLARLISYRLGRGGPGMFDSAFLGLKTMGGGATRDEMVDVLIEACRAHGEKKYLAEAGRLYTDKMKRHNLFDFLLAECLAAKDVAGALGAYDALGRKPRSHEKELIVAAALASGDHMLMRGVCTFFDREPPTDVELAKLAGAALKKAKVNNALKAALAMSSGAEKIATCRQIVDAFGKNSQDPVAFVNETLQTIRELTQDERGPAYEHMMAACVRSGMFAVAHRVEDASGRKLKNAEIKTMLEVGRERNQGYKDYNLNLAKRMEDGPDKIETIAAMIPDFVADGVVDAAKSAADLISRKLTHEEIRILIKNALHIGTDVFARAVMLLNTTLSEDEAVELLSR